MPIPRQTASLLTILSSCWVLSVPGEQQPTRCWSRCRARRVSANSLRRLRTTAGAAGAALAAAPGVDVDQGNGRAPDAASVNAALAAVARVIRPSRLLALIDVSGSMGHAVPGTKGATRLDLAVQASLSGLAVYPDDAAIGLWVFSTDLTRSTDYRVLAPLEPLTRGADGISGRERMAHALAKVTIEKGRTGLYDSILAAVREVRRTWDPDRVNSVVLITDGADSDRRTIGKEKLLAQPARRTIPNVPSLSSPSPTGQRATGLPWPRSATHGWPGLRCA